jgi:hypothetical protein
MSRPKVSRPVCLEIKHSFGAYDQIFISVRQLRVCWCKALSLTRGLVCRLQLLLALASTAILGFRVLWDSRPHFTQIRDFFFRRLLLLAGLFWRYSTPPPHAILTKFYQWLSLYSRQSICCWVLIRLGEHVLIKPLPSNGIPFWLHYSASQVSCDSVIYWIRPTGH